MTVTTITTREPVTERARRLWDGDAHSTAQALLYELFDELDPEDFIDALVPWMADRVRSVMRADVRAAEESAWTDPAGQPQRVAREIRDQSGTLPELDNLELLLSLPVLVPRPGSGRQSVAWRDMTADDHRARIGMLRRPLKAVQDAIGRHEWSIAQIEEHGARCLGDIDVAILRAGLPKPR